MNKMTVILLIIPLLTGCAGSASDSGREVSGGSSVASPASSTAQASPAAQASSAASASPPATAPPTASASDSAVQYVLGPQQLQPNFGFADESGRYILVTGHEEGEQEQMERLDTAIGVNGQVWSVKFKQWQPGSEKSNAREAAHNFANLPGYLFVLEDGGAVKDRNYYLADSSQLDVQSLIPVKTPATQAAAEAVPDQLRSSITAAKGREIQKIWKLADLTEEREVYVVQFVRMDKDMLFSIVVSERGSLAFMDYPAEIGDNEYSVWRVDDGGEIMPETFSVIFAAQTKNGLLLGLEWWGAEGVITYFVTREGAGFKELDIQYSRYTSPL
ncbi:hypothetical protein [Paenibacillus donghaensis]|uniref:DUF4367 domain-containing protein n=1 Tax=Paenibacillus donghaensis TaxID=414771 RepID=A0A2Z2KD16_9BACL|nr:hypothetical protein [Paenibacillus donghaensis]ASA20853.1 hypothetical protein B9T62_08705 [Paenibacillus donghaensis]